MSTRNQRPKEEQLARIRKNQQKCRQRKKEHVEELERRIRDLQRQIEVCSPCPAVRITESETRLNEAQKQNRALRDLLSGLGIDEQSQQRYLESSARREAVRSLLRSESAEENDMQLKHIFRDDVIGLSHVASDEASGFPQTISNDIPDPGIQNFDLLSPENPLGDLTAFGSSQPTDFNEAWFNASSFNDLHLLNSSLTLQTSDRLKRSPIVQPFTSNCQFQSSLICDNPAAVQGLANAIIPAGTAETTTLCSVALSMVFQNNRKRLTLDELQSRLRCGFRKAIGTSQECRLENKVLFQVLAEISD